MFFSVVSSKNKDGTTASKSVKPQGSFVSHSSESKHFPSFAHFKSNWKSLENCFVCKWFKRKGTAEAALTRQASLQCLLDNLS